MRTKEGKIKVENIGRGYVKDENKNLYLVTDSDPSVLESQTTGELYKVTGWDENHNAIEIQDLYEFEEDQKMHTDYIERAAACKVINEMNTFTFTREAAIDMLTRIPAAPVVERKTGEWIDTGFENSTGPIMQCPVCNGTINPSKKAIELGRQKERPHFCENCGADLRVKAERQ